MPKARRSSKGARGTKASGGKNPKQPDVFAKKQRNGLQAALIVSTFIGSALGPRGSYKMMVKNDNFVRPVMVTKDGHEALARLEIEHPVAKVMMEAGKWMHFTIGDGSITSIILAGALIRRAETLMQAEVHPSMIADGYSRAHDKAQEILRSLAQKFDVEDRESVLRIARTSLETKLPPDEAAFLAPLVADAIGKVKDRNHLGVFVDPDQIDVIKKIGGTIYDSQLISGVGLWREPTRYWMPYDIRDARIAFITEQLQTRLIFPSPIFRPEIQIKDPAMMKAFKDEEWHMLMQKIDPVIKTGANVIVSSQTYDDHVQVALGRLGIMAIRKANEHDHRRLAKACGGKILAECANITKDDLGYAGHIFVKNLEGDNWIFFEQCRDPKAVSFLIRGSTSNVVEAAGSAIKSAVNCIDRATRDGMVYPGGGALEAELAFRLKAWARTLHGKQQLAAMRYAEALESIPTMLAQTSGLKPLDSMIKIRSEHANGNPSFGVNVVKMKLADMQDSGVLDVLSVKSQILKTATETAVTMVKVDGVFSRPKFVPKKKKHPGPGGQRMTAEMPDPNYHPPAEVRRFMPKTW